MSTTDEAKVDFGHSGKGLSPVECQLMTTGTITVGGVTYTTKSVTIVDQFTDPTLLPTYNVGVEICNHPCLEKGTYLATGTLQQCYEYILKL